VAYAELVDLKDHLGETRSDFDDLMERALASATEAVNNWTHRRFDADETASSRLFRGLGAYIETDDFTELISLAPETSYGVLGTAVDSTYYRAAPLNAAVYGEPYHCIEGSFTWGVYSVEAVWGWPSVPASITQATLLIAAALFKRRESISGVLGFDEFAVRVTREDPDVTRLLSSYRFITVA
jgi:hypothetical protein